MKVKKVDDNVFIDASSKVKVTKMNHLYEVQYMHKCNANIVIKKLSATHYVDLRDGEIKEFVKTSNRQQSLNTLRQTFKNLRYLINTNFYGALNEHHYTLTYHENMTDPKKLYNDFKDFLKRYKKHLSKNYNSQPFEYIAIVEPQGRGAWHIHLLMRYEGVNSFYIPSSDLEAIWKGEQKTSCRGYVKIKSLQNIDNIGAYLSAYLANVELTEENVVDFFANSGKNSVDVIERVDEDGNTKRYIKGGRLHMYPSGMNLYRQSRGIVKPERIEMKYSDFKNSIGDLTPTYARAYEILNSDDEYSNCIIHEQYNLKRN